MAVNETKKTETAKVETKVAEAKTATPAKEVAKKEDVKKAAPAKKATKKKGAKRGPKPASERTVELTVQFGEKEVTYTELVTRVKDMWKEQGKRETSLKTLNIYVKPEESKAYYVINDKITGDMDF
nr:hypothetical protein [Eubacterium sp.]